MKFNLYAVSTICTYFNDVEADSLEEAIGKTVDMMEDRNLDLCNYCSNEMEMDDNWEIKESGQ